MHHRADHYHVAVRSPEKSIAIATQLQHHLPLFLLLSASSPYWEAHDTGMASSRIKVFESLPTAGLPPRLGNWREFEEFMATLIKAGCIKSIREVWWDSGSRYRRANGPSGRTSGSRPDTAWRTN